MTPNNRDILRHLRALSTYQPSPDSSSHALDSTRRALLQTRASSSRKRVLLRLSIPSAIAACLLAAAFLWSSQPSASASEQFQQVVDSAKSYDGWIHIVTIPPQIPPQNPARSLSFPIRVPSSITYDANVSQGLMAEVRQFEGDTQITFRSLQSHTLDTYTKKTNEIRRLTWTSAPGTHEEEEHDMAPRDLLLPRCLAGTLARVKSTLGHDPSLKKFRDGNDDRFDVTLFASHEEEENFHRHSLSPSGTFPAATPIPPLTPSHFSLWVGKNNSPTRLQFDTPVGTLTSTITYGTPPLHSIYDLGVPRDARIIPVSLRDHDFNYDFDHDLDRDDRPRNPFDRD